MPAPKGNQYAKGHGQGRPSEFNNEIATKICARIAAGESMRNICKEDDMPDRATVHLWLLNKDNKDFTIQYETACNTRAENMFEELLEISDDGTNDFMERESKDGGKFSVLNSEAVSRSRLRVDTRKWFLSKVMPKKYGERLDLTTNGKDIPQPIINLNGIHRNDSNAENKEA